MSEIHGDIYAATCNPSRRAKRVAMANLVEQQLSSPEPLPRAVATAAQPRAILPMPTSEAQDMSAAQPSTSKQGRKPSNAGSSTERPYAPRVSTLVTTTDPPPPPAKRGRKPGPLSKSAREAQRRLNHSIIEKARRTKINDALATLKQLVPADYLQNKQKTVKDVEDDDEEEEEDEEYEGSNQKTKTKPKKEEKEFKLEILERTVAFLQDLLVKIDDLEAGSPLVCHNCGTDVQASKKRKRANTSESTRERSDREPVMEPRSKLPRTDSQRVSQSPAMHPVAESSGSLHASPASRPSRGPSASPYTTALAERERLPSISSWLPNTSEIDPQLLPPPLVKRSSTTTSTMGSPYLPSPPSSTHFDPVRMGGAGPPMLNLGPSSSSVPFPSTSRSHSSIHGAKSSSKSPSLSSSSSASNGSGSVRTPEDESAASMLLHIATSPLFRATSSSGTALPDPSAFSLHSGMDGRSRSQSRGQRELGIEPTKQALTPSEILGMRRA